MYEAKTVKKWNLKSDKVSCIRTKHHGVIYVPYHSSVTPTAREEINRSIQTKANTINLKQVFESQ